MRNLLTILGIWLFLIVLHYSLRCLPYYWDEAGYYAIASLDFYRHALLIPQSTWPIGHTPLVPAIVGTAWRIFGVSPCVARTAMLLLAAATVAATYWLGRRVLPPVMGVNKTKNDGSTLGSSLEPAAWSAVLIAVSPLFFAQSDMLHIDLAAGLFTTLAVLSILPQGEVSGSRNFVSIPHQQLDSRSLVGFAIAGSLAILSKETSVIVLPPIWAYAWAIRRERQVWAWFTLALPILPLAVWTIHYHRVTGFWTGNGDYLKYNLYGTLDPVRFLLSLLRRLYQFFVGGFNWLLVGLALAGVWRGSKAKLLAQREERDDESGTERTENLKPVELAGIMAGLCSVNRFTGFLLLAGGLSGVSLMFHSLVGGALLRRYLLPVFPLLFVSAMGLAFRLPRLWARSLSVLLAGCFVASSFINPPYPFAFEDNLAYADFVALHREAARYLEDHSSDDRILSAWPATGELTTPFVGYVTRPLRVVAIDDFTPADFERMDTGSFDVLYLYSRKWQPNFDLLRYLPVASRLEQRYFDYAQPANEDLLVRHYHLRLLTSFERRGQWVRIYGR